MRGVKKESGEERREKRRRRGMGEKKNKLTEKICSVQRKIE